MRRRSALGAFVLAACTLSDCLDPTEIVVKISTDVACAVVQQNGVAIAVGPPGQDTTGVVTKAMACDDGGVGTLVLTPSHGIDDEVGIRVMLARSAQSDTCAGPSFSGCIVARRSLRYISHTPLELPIELTQDCFDTPCDPSSTCVAAQCVDAGVTCANGDCVLVEAGALDASVDVSDAGGCDVSETLVASSIGLFTPRIARISTGYVVAWIDGNDAVTGAQLDASGHVVGPLQHLGNVSVSSATLGPFGTSGANYAILFSDGANVTWDTVPIGGGTEITLTQSGTSLLEGFVYSTWRSQFVAVGNFGTGAQFVTFDASSPFAGGLPLTTPGANELSLAFSNAVYYAAFHDPATDTCYVQSYDDNGTNFSIAPQILSTQACRVVRIAPTMTTSRFIATIAGTDGTLGVYAPDLNTGTFNITTLDDPEAVLPLALGAEMRAVWRTNDTLTTNMFVPSLGVPFDLATTDYAARGAQGAGFDVVADDSVNAMTWAVVYVRANNLYFQRRCQ